MTTFSHLECGLCRRTYQPSEAQGVCRCGGLLLARYDLELARRSWSRDWVRNAPATMWRYTPVLPVRTPGSVVSLGEGMTPLVRAERLGRRLGLNQLWIKDEGRNPTGSVKARGIACAISMILELEKRLAVIASLGNAAVGVAAYAASAGLEAHVFLPRSAARSVIAECRLYGAQVTLVEGGLAECVRALDRLPAAEGRHDLSAPREPYRLEGAKTLGYELAEQFNWDLPEAVLYPVGQGLGLVAIRKAFEEMEILGWIPGHTPRLIAVQTEGCRPLVEAFRQQRERAEPVRSVATVAAETAVEEPAGDFLALRALLASRGAAVAVTDSELLEAGLQMARLEGVLPSPEGAACAAAIPKLVEAGALDPHERVVLINTAGGLRSLEVWARRLGPAPAAETDKLGGLITPR